MTDEHIQMNSSAGNICAPGDAVFDVFYDYCNLGGVTSIFKQRIELLRRVGSKFGFSFHFASDLGGRDELERIPGVFVQICPGADFRSWSTSKIENSNHPIILIDQPEILSNIGCKDKSILYEVHTSLEQAFKRMRGVEFTAVSRIACPSRWVKDKLREVIPLFPSEKVDIIPNFVDCDKFSPINEEYDQIARRPILWVGKLNIEKNSPDAISILERLSGSHSIFPIFLTGGGADQAAVVKFLSRLRSSRLIEESQWIVNLPNHDMPRLLNIVRANGGVFLSTSKFESFGLAALEAMSCGVPVVAAGVGGLKEVVRDGSSGFLYELGDIETAVGCIERLLSDGMFYEWSSRQARLRAIEFSGEVTTKFYSELLTKIAAQ
jgi:glycosyltransferase involved in cell wall biosynthesis